MGWNDHEPAFSWIENKADELMEEGYSYEKAWETATELYMTRWD